MNGGAAPHTYVDFQAWSPGGLSELSRTAFNAETGATKDAGGDSVLASSVGTELSRRSNDLRDTFTAPEPRPLTVREQALSTAVGIVLLVCFIALLIEDQVA